MAEPPRSESADREDALRRCVRDLATLNALPSMCVGRSPQEALEIIADALPTALACPFVYLKLPGSPPEERASLGGAPLSDEQLAHLRSVTKDDADGTAAEVFLGGRRLWCLEAEVPIGEARGRLLVGRPTPLEADTDRVLVRTAANIVGTTLRAANVLEEARRKDEFLAILGHELRNPLAPILTAVELLGRRSEVARERIIIERQTRHLARLVDDLLDISRVTRGHVELRSEQLSIRSALERGIEIAAPLISRHRHSLRVSDIPDLTLRGDPVRLAQVFANLLSNAAKFTPPGGNIGVTVEGRPGNASITVRDNGRGIRRDQLARIFEPFVQAERERDALCGGLGLGLAIVKSLVERHGGTIAVTSDGPGCGATFSVTLPTIEGRETPVQPAHSPHAGARAGRRVLVVDDNVDIAELLSEALTEEGFDTAVEHDAQAALQRWRSFAPHAGVLDVGLPDADGYELAMTLRAEHGPAPTLIAATGYAQPHDRLRAVEAGFDCHLVKPISIDELVMVLDKRLAS